MKPVVLYYSEGSMPLKFQEACFSRLVEVIPSSMDLLCIVPSSLKDMVKDHYSIIHECSNRGYTDLKTRLKIGCMALPPKTPIALAEHDVIYGPGHFQPFDIINPFMWPSVAGVKLSLDNKYRIVKGVLLTLRSTSTELLNHVQSGSKVLEPDAKVACPGYIANHIDIRWKNNFTLSTASPLTAHDTGHLPPPLHVRKWVDNLILHGVDDPLIKIKPRKAWGDLTG